MSFNTLRISIFFISLALNQCYAHFVIDNKSLLQEIPKEFASSKKIALIGFNTYDYRVASLKLNKIRRNIGVITKSINSEGFRYYLVATARTEKAFMNSFGIGKDLSEYSISETISGEINYYMLEIIELF